MPSDTKAVSFLLALLLLFLPLLCEIDDSTPKREKSGSITNVREHIWFPGGAVVCASRSQRLLNVMWCGFCFFLHCFCSSVLVSLPYCIVWMDVSISAMWVIFGETYNLLSSVGPGCASFLSEAMWTLQRRLAPLPLCPACPWSTSFFCDQRGFSPYLATARPLFSQSGKRPGCSSWEWKEA